MPLRDEIEKIIDDYTWPKRGDRDKRFLLGRDKKRMVSAIIEAILKEWPKEEKQEILTSAGIMESDLSIGFNQALALCRKHVEGIGEG